MVERTQKNATERILVVRNLSYTYDCSRFVLENIDLSVRKGEFLLITGPSGAGKSTLVHCMSGIIPHYISSGEMRGEVVVAGKNTRETELCELAKHVGVVLQNPEWQTFGMSVEEDVAFGLENLCFPSDQIASRIENVLSFLELEGYRSFPPEILSGGQRQKLAFGSVLALEPEIIVLEEPLSHLDAWSTELVVSTLKRLKNSGRTVVLVERKIESVLEYLDRIVAIEGGRKVADCSPTEFFKARYLVERLRINVPQQVKLSYALVDSGFVADCVPLSGAEEKDHCAKPIVDIRDLWFAYQDRDWILKGIDLEIFEGEFVSIVGQNGCGKTTLAKHFNGLLKPTRGKVFVDGKDTSRYTTAQLSRTVGYVFQNPDRQIFANTVYDEVAFGIRNSGITDPDPVVLPSLEEVQLEDRVHDSPFCLSAGEKERLAIASMIAMQPKVLVMDEPTTGQDEATTKKIMEIAMGLRRKGTTIVLITHDMDVVAQWAGRVIVMQDGRIIRVGRPRDVLSDREFLKRARLSAPRSVEIGVSLGIRPPPITLQELVCELKR